MSDEASPSSNRWKAPCTVPCACRATRSISHRAVLFSAMAEGTSRVSGVLDSADVRSVHRGRARAWRPGAAWRSRPTEALLAASPAGAPPVPAQPAEPVDCGNSGTTVRLLMGILAPWDIQVTLTGDSSLCKRPMRRITAPLMKMGARFLPEGRETLPITVHGGGAAPPHLRCPHGIGPAQDSSAACRHVRAREPPRSTSRRRAATTPSSCCPNTAWPPRPAPARPA